MIRSLALLLLATVLLNAAQAQTLPDHSTFDRVLKRYVHGELVDYAGLQADRVDLDLYIVELGRTSPSALAIASRDQRLAFWINAYNACTLKLVIDHYPIEKRNFAAGLVNSLRGIPDNSIRQIPNTFDGKFCRVAHQERSLDEIEHSIIRPLGDPRIHFAVNCAARSCPVLAVDAYTADSLNLELEAAVHRFVAEPRQYLLERSGRAVIRVNKVLDWYGEDFGGEEGVIEFLLRYVSEEDADYIRAHGRPKLVYEDYDWTLNDTAVFGDSG